MSGATRGSTGGGLPASVLVAVLGLAIGGAAGWLRAAPSAPPESQALQMASALRQVDPVLMRRALLAAIEHASPEAMPALLEGFEREARFTDRCTTSLFIASWAAFDAEAAIEAVRRWEVATRRSHAFAEIAYGLGLGGRIDDAEELIASLPLSRVRHPTQAGLVGGIVRSGDLARAEGYLERRDSTHRNRLIEAFLRHFLLRGDLEAAMAWAEAIPADARHGLKRSAFALTARWLSGVDPRRAADWYDAQPADADFTRLAHLAIAEEWTEQDPEAALAWVTARTRPETARADLRNVLRRYIDRDPHGAAEWIARQDPLGPAEAGVPQLVFALEEERPDQALGWALRIADTRRRENALVRVAAGWLARDPAAARAWMAANPLPAVILDRLRAEHPGALEDLRS